MQMIRLNVCKRNPKIEWYEIKNKSIITDDAIIREKVLHSIGPNILNLQDVKSSNENLELPGMEIYVVEPVSTKTKKKSFNIV